MEWALFKRERVAGGIRRATPEDWRKTVGRISGTIWKGKSFVKLSPRFSTSGRRKGTHASVTVPV